MPRMFLHEKDVSLNHRYFFFALHSVCKKNPHNFEHAMKGNRNYYFAIELTHLLSIERHRC